MFALYLKMGNKNYYVVTSGRKCGIFRNWHSVQMSVNKYSGQCYKGFATIGEALAFWRESHGDNTPEIFDDVNEESDTRSD